MLLLYLDAYHLGDPLFLTQLARDLAHRGGGGLLVHGSGEAGERALEATGAVARQREGVWAVETAEQAALIEKATRELNRQIVHELNEAGVPAIRVIGADRGLVKLEGGDVRAGATNWLTTLIGQGVVGVVASLVDVGADELAEVDPVEAVRALAGAVPGAVATALQQGAGPPNASEAAAWQARIRHPNAAARLISRSELRAR